MEGNVWLVMSTEFILNTYHRWMIRVADFWIEKAMILWETGSFYHFHSDRSLDMWKNEKVHLQVNEFLNKIFSSSFIFDGKLKNCKHAWNVRREIIQGCMQNLISVNRIT